MNNGIPGGTVVKDPPANAGDAKRWGFNPWVRKIPWSRKWKSIPVFLLGQRSLVGYSPWHLKELDTTEHMPTCLTQDDNVMYIISLDITLAEFGEGNGTPLQYSCLENPMDGGAWWAAVHGASKSRTWLSDFTFTFYLHALEKEMATHSSVLAWRIPGTGEPGGLLSMGSHRVGHDWSNLAAAA